MTIKFLPAFNGDCILISFVDSEGANRNILIDGGTPASYQKMLKPLYKELESNIDLLVVTHIDDDHIGGIKKLFEDTRLDKSRIKKVWFNSGGLLNHYFGENEDLARAVSIVPNDITDMSLAQGNKLEAKLDELNGVWVKKIFKKGDKIDVHDCSIEILSPNDVTLTNLNQNWETEINIQVNMSGKAHDDFKVDIDDLVKRPFKEDTAVPNGSSIAFLLEFGGIKGLLLGDAFPSVIVESLKGLGYSKDHKLNLDFVKISHHASKGNTSPELLDIISCDNFIICTNGQKHGLPDKETLARVISTHPNCTLHFNYNVYLEDLFTENDKQTYNFNIVDLSIQNYTLNF
ncbi:MAG: MBL fold metallo-hydrolase [Saprospiraceae bacterium]